MGGCIVLGYAAISGFKRFLTSGIIFYNITRTVLLIIGVIIIQSNFIKGGLVMNNRLVNVKSKRKEIVYVLSCAVEMRT